METYQPKTCKACNKTIRGRSDKKFCNDYCRNAYNNQLKSPSNNLVRNTNNRLSKNRRILENISENQSGLIKIKKENLVQMGFDFNFTTQVQKSKQGKSYFYCYEFGYLPINNEWCLIIKKEENINISGGEL